MRLLRRAWQFDSYPILCRDIAITTGVLVGRQFYKVLIPHGLALWFSPDKAHGLQRFLLGLRKGLGFTARVVDPRGHFLIRLIFLWDQAVAMVLFVLVQLPQPIILRAQGLALVLRSTINSHERHELANEIYTFNATLTLPLLARGVAVHGVMR
jgi:hypothetical protein